MFRNLLLISLMFCSAAALGQEMDTSDPLIQRWYGHFAHGEMVTFHSSVFSGENPGRVGVAIGDHPDLAQCDLTEHQAVRAWDGDSASFRVDAESFNPGDEVYVFLIGEEGATTDGYPVTLGDQVPHPDAPGQPGQPVAETLDNSAEF